MSKICKGCGVTLQTENPNAIGFVQNMDQEYCKRCYRLSHYGDVMINMQQGIDNDALLQSVNALDALIVWVVDIMDFEASIIPGMNRHFMGKDILLVCTKSDLLPKTTSAGKMGNFIQNRLRTHGIQVVGIIAVPNLHKQEAQSVSDVEAAIAMYRKQRDVVMLGNANAGKSTLLNALMHSHDLTISHHPGTTLDLNPIPFDGYTLYDTPGMVNTKSYLTYVPETQLKDVMFHKEVNPKKFQLRQNQSLALAGYVRLDLFDCEDVSCVCYFSDRLAIHRSKAENADRLWSEHLGELLAPTIEEDASEMKKTSFTKKEDKIDIVIAGLGWFCIHGNVSRIDVYANKHVDVLLRKAMI
ncbi:MULTISPECIES: ribosome biogenesis GTPase YqeH [Breznakia]|uniref:Uncharacterized protein n=1 Tax=Breznakia blatticola TaxID=1754012 RepID=A0A4R8A785_9FIRM|nr:MULTISPECIES: ribosome biogenesis GTPase YqeH [Breznakia]MDH6366068.1 ribosome biogenesis GTPase YqeH [Breznakia sp. PH1-1]MDH6403000.1 ribosome biogenesis GTPase YqeH [Breznakia sp. PF1-11]MDH6410709.1 ribosome biogenesis GTPase YqeH [Breznakia sp. PFB1-11]MDH6413234.1 ribosome biogenesis GTPase YqeH [Breznakia sp. PFB1-14]MDH6415602.1 ribosome biogenesis GTPase YqeH [Breznakia sp. PFB1-4]